MIWKVVLPLFLWAIIAVGLGTSLGLSFLEQGREEERQASTRATFLFRMLDSYTRQPLACGRVYAQKYFGTPRDRSYVSGESFFDSDVGGVVKVDLKEGNYTLYFTCKQGLYDVVVRDEWQVTSEQKGSLEIRDVFLFSRERF
jgi:hypothetical protein